MKFSITSPIVRGREVGRLTEPSTDNYSQLVTHFVQHVPASCRCLYLRLRLEGSTVANGTHTFLAIDWRAIKRATAAMTMLDLLAVRLSPLRHGPLPNWNAGKLSAVRSMLPGHTGCRCEYM